MADLTPEELERERQRKQQEQQSMLSSLFGGFGFGDILMIGLVLAVGYFLARTEWGKDAINWLGEQLGPDAQVFINKFFKSIGIDGVGIDEETYIRNQTPEQRVETLKSQGMSQEMAAEFADFAPDYMKTVKEVDGASADYTKPSANAVKTFILRNPTVIPVLAKAAAQQGSAGGMQDQVAKLLPEILGDRTFVAQLLSSPVNRAYVAQAAVALSGLPVAPEKMDAFLATASMKDGQPTPELMQFLTAMAGSDANAKTQAALALLKTTDAESVHALLGGMTPEQIAAVPADMKGIVQLAQNKETLASVFSFITQLPAEEQTKLLAAVQQGDEAQLMSAVQEILGKYPQLAPAAKDAVHVFISPADAAAADVAISLSAKGIDPVQLANSALYQAVVANPNDASQATINPVQVATNLVHILLDTTYRGALSGDVIQEMGKAIEAAGLDDPSMKSAVGFITAKDGAGNYTNLHALVGFMNDIGSNPENQGANASQTKKVMTALSRFLVTQDPAELSNLSAKELSQFFAIEGNARAFGTVLNRLDATALGDKAAGVIDVLKRKWGNLHEGVVEALSCEEGAALLLAALKGEQQTDYGSVINWMGKQFVDDRVTDNEAALREVATAFENAKVTDATTVAVVGPAPSVPGTPSVQAAIH